MGLQIQKPMDREIKCQGEKPLRYLALNQLAHREEEETAVQPNLTELAEIMSLMRRKPNPAFDFGRQTEFQLRRPLLACSGAPDQKKFLIHFSKKMQTEEGMGTTRRM